MQAEARSEHQWLHRMLGDWSFTGSCVTAPGEPPAAISGRESVRSLGGLWIVAEGEGETPGGGTASNLMQIGFDPAKGRFVGTFTASVMTHLWVYEGTLDASQQVLTLEAEGPAFTGQGTARYRDVMTLDGDGGRGLTSSALDEKGVWQEFMRATYTRVAAGAAPA